MYLQEILYFYHKQLSSFLGAYPSLKRIFCMFFYDPSLAWRVLMGPSIPAVYRLFGPHTQWDLSRNSIMNLRDHCFYSTRNINYPRKQTSRMWPLFNKIIMAAVAIAIGAILAKRL